MHYTMKIRFLLLLSALLALTSCGPKVSYITNEGFIYGTTYHIKYLSPNGRDLHQGIEETLNRLDQSLSTFNPNSVISRINSNEEVFPDELLLTVFNKAQEISEITGGAFDMTVAPLVNAWGFGFKNKETITPELIDSLRQLVGYEKVRFEEGMIVKKNPGIMLDGSAIAKGFAVDLVARYLDSQACTNYMVEIGGEVSARGINPSGKFWTIGISRPDENNPFDPGNLKAIVSLKNKALATSGNYRNFYEEDGKKYAHTIDPHSGYPAQHSLLSATVLADDCMTADAFATAFMVLGLDKSIELSQQLDYLDVYFIYSDEGGKMKSYFSDGFKDLIQKEIQ